MKRLLLVSASQDSPALLPTVFQDELNCEAELICYEDGLTSEDEKTLDRGFAIAAISTSKTTDSKDVAIIVREIRSRKREVPIVIIDEDRRRFLFLAGHHDISFCNSTKEVLGVIADKFHKMELRALAIRRRAVA